MSGVAILVPSRSGGGAEFVATQWAEALAGRGNDVVVVTTHERPGAVDPSVGFRVSALDSDLSFAQRVRALRSVLRSERPEVLISLMPHWNVLALLASKNLGPVSPKVVISGRNIESGLRRTLGTSYRAELALARSLYRGADAYVAISHPVAAEAIAKYGISPERVWVVPNPASAKVQSHEASDARVRRATIAPRSQLAIAVPGRLVAQKRPHLVIETAATMNRIGKGKISVDFFGTGPLESEIVNLAALRGIDVRMHGWVDRWFDECPDESVVLLPSRVEGFGNVFVEAAAYGMPSVATSRALGVADAIAPGFTGVLASDDSPESLAVAVERARHITVPVELADWLQNFSVANSAERLEEVIEYVLS